MRRRHCKPHRRHRRHERDFEECCPFDVEAISTPIAQSANEDGKNSGGNLFDEVKESDIELDLIVTERGRGRQKVV